MAALDPVSFLRATPPFGALPPALFDLAAGALEIAFFPAGARLAERGGAPLRHLFVIRKGAVRLERGGETFQLVEEGEAFGYTSLLTGRASFDAVVEEDLLAYALPAEVFTRLLEDARFASHFAAGLAERLRSTLEVSGVGAFATELGAPVSGLVRSPPVWLGRGATVGEAARRMREHRVSSVLVEGEPPGIVTDGDLRNRVLAEGLGPDAPLDAVATRPLRSVPERTAVYEAWQALLDGPIQHLPVTREGEIVGVLTSGDLLRTAAQGPLGMLRSVERLASRHALPGYAERVARMASALQGGGLDAPVIAGFVARLNDALVRRVLRWAEAELGTAPAPYAWLALGSEGRREQTLLTDQDNALVHGGGDGARPWFARLAERANADLEAAGFPPCEGGYMARRWHGPLEEWLARFRGWVETPQPRALLEAAIFFDFRKVHGALELGALEDVLAGAAAERPFLSALARAALEFRPPPSLVLRLRGEEVDLKRHGLSPIVLLARASALEAGSSARNTLDRLDAAADAGLIGPDVRDALREAFRFLLALRLREALRRGGASGPASSAVALSSLSSVERSRLKDSLRAVRDWQEKAAHRLRA